MSATDASIPAPDTARRSPWSEVLYSLLRSATFLTGFAIVLFWISCALFGEHFVPYDPLVD
ncbi:ABC transporter permease, partial [Mesorhizobium sp. M3A.F.Ca.ET.201.01.1.1]